MREAACGSLRLWCVSELYRRRRGRLRDRIHSICWLEGEINNGDPINMAEMLSHRLLQRPVRNLHPTDPKLTGRLLNQTCPNRIHRPHHHLRSGREYRHYGLLPHRNRDRH